MNNLKQNINLQDTFKFIHDILKSRTAWSDDVTGTNTSREGLEMEKSFYYFNKSNQQIASLSLLSDRIEYSEISENEEQFNTLLTNEAESN